MKRCGRSKMARPVAARSVRSGGFCGAIGRIVVRRGTVGHGAVGRSETVTADDWVRSTYGKGALSVIGRGVRACGATSQALQWRLQAVTTGRVLRTGLLVAEESSG